MRHSVIMGLVLGCVGLAGCSTGTLPSMSFNDDASSSRVSSPPRASMAMSTPASAPASTTAPQKVQASPSSDNSDGNVLNDIWDNFSSAFRSGTPQQSTPPTQQTVTTTAAADKVQFDIHEALQLVNAFRAKHKLKPLQLDPRAEKAAALLTADMAKNDHMSHYGPNNADVAKRLNFAGYDYKVAAENVGVGQRSVKEMVDGWEKSPPHRKNMLLKDVTHMGISMEYSPATKYKTFWALVLAAPS